MCLDYNWLAKGHFFQSDFFIENKKAMKISICLYLDVNFYIFKYVFYIGKYIFKTVTQNIYIQS